MSLVCLILVSKHVYFQQSLYQTLHLMPNYYLFVAVSLQI